MKKSPNRLVMTTLAMSSALAVTAGVFSVTSGTSAHAASSSKQLVFYSAQGYDAAMATAFQKKTGIKVRLHDDSTGNIVALIEAQRANPHWDVAWFDGDSTMQSLDNQGILLRGFKPSGAKNYTPLGKSLIPADRAYYPASITAAAAIAYNTKLVKPSQAPKTWSDLLKPEFKNAVAMNNPIISGPTYPFVAGILQQMGTAKGEQYFKNLKANGLKVFPTNGVTLQALLGGQVKAIMIQDSALTNAKVSGDPIRIVYPKSGVYMLPGVIAIDKNAPDLAAAKEFVNFVLSKQGQSVMLNPKNGGGDSFFNPIIKGLKPNKARQQSGIVWIRVNAKKAAAILPQVDQWFNENIVQ